MEINAYFEERVLDEEYAVPVVYVVCGVSTWPRHGKQEHAVVEERVGHVHERAIRREWGLGGVQLIHGRRREVLIVAGRGKNDEEQRLEDA